MNNKTIEKSADPAFIGQAQNDVQKLVERMKQTPCGEIAGYRELSQLIGRFRLATGASAAARRAA